MKSPLTRRRAEKSASCAPISIAVLFFICIAFSASYFCRAWGTPQDGSDPTGTDGAPLTSRITDEKSNNGVTVTDPVTDNSADTNEDAGAGTSDADAWMLILVNRNSPLPADFSVTLTDLSGGQSADARVAGALLEMLGDMRRDGLSPVICSSYRTEEKQRQLYENEVRTYLSRGMARADAEAAAAMWVAIPGTSEHQTGLAFDIVDSSYQLLDEGQEKTPVQRWLMANSYRYGFILRYPNSKSGITGISYEPWHYRYVGKKAAAEIYSSGLCLEEYLGARPVGDQDGE